MDDYDFERCDPGVCPACGSDDPDAYACEQCASLWQLLEGEV